MSAGINPGYLAKLTERQQAFARKAVGVKFVKEFVWVHGQHCFIFGTTGSGKTQKAYSLVSWLMHTECILWLSSAKPNEILPLFTLGKKIRIIKPAGADFTITGNPPAPYDIIEVSSPLEAWKAVKAYSWDKNRNKVYDTINIFEFRGTMSDKYGGRSEWMQEFFEILARDSRLGKLKIFPCSIFMDEAQWLVTGRRISVEGKRSKTSEVVTENALEMRSAGCRFVIMSQGFKNVPPAMRENMLFSLLCRGAKVERAENESLAYHCNLRPGPESFKVDEGKFVYPDGSTYPNMLPKNSGKMMCTWKFQFYPNPPDCNVTYGRHYVPKPKEPDFVESIPEDIGVYSNKLTKPEPEPILSRWGGCWIEHN